MNSSSSSRVVGLRDNAAKMLAEANREIRKLFRTTRKSKLSARGGVILLVDDMPQQKTVLENMIDRYNLAMKVENVVSADEAMMVVSSNPNNIRMVIADIMLIGSAAAADGTLTKDGLSFVAWLREMFPDIPFVITTGHIEKAEEAADRFPGVDVLVKGQTNIEEYADAIGLDDFVGAGEVIPEDE